MRKFRQNRKNLGLTVLILSMMFLANSCYYDNDANNFEIPGPGTEISFSANVMPIFNQNCNSAGCHNGMGQSPDLSPGNAYNSLFDNNLIDLNDPESSEIIVRMTSTSNPMPTSGLLPSAQVNVITEWIRQGALNN